MLPLLNAAKRLCAVVLAGAAVWSASAQGGYAPNGGEYLLTGGLPGDQTQPAVSVGTSGGFVVWQDNATDGDGLGISARRLDQTLSGSFSAFRVNQQGVGDQSKPRVALLNSGGAVIVWQGGAAGNRRIYARFLKADGTFATGDILVNTYATPEQIDPDVAVLGGGNVLVTWASQGEDGSLLGVYAQRLSPAGAKLGSEFRVNQVTAYNQRSPAVAALSDGGFLVAWVSEQQRFENSVDIYSRRFNSTGAALGNEALVNTDTNVCANPVVCVAADGSFNLAWSQRDTVVVTNGWDVWTRSFAADGAAAGEPFMVNQTRRGNQYGPRLASLGSMSLCVWTSDGQDGSREGVFGRFLSGGDVSGGEFMVNTTTVNQQIHPVVISDGNDRFLVAWASFLGGTVNFEILGQRYSPGQTIPDPAPPFVTALDQSDLSVTWPDATGYPISRYLVYVDDSSTPVAVTNSAYVVTGLTPGSTHSVRIAYQLQNGWQSRPSAPATARTWGRDANFDGLPDDWQARYWGSDPAQWPSPNADSDGDGATNLQEFLAGTDPTDAGSVLRITVESTAQGPHLNWNTQPGCIYQVRISPDLTAWSDLGGTRFAPGTADSLPITEPQTTAYFRVVRVR